jgi:hypothetical protein
MSWRAGLPLVGRWPTASAAARDSCLAAAPRSGPATGELAAVSAIQRRSLNVSDNREFGPWDTHRRACIRRPS